MEKVMESHGITKAPKSMNPVRGLGVNRIENGS